MTLSVIVPAYNEESTIERCLTCIREATRPLASPLDDPQIIVVDNDSTDDTANRARDLGATVIFEGERRIAGARNAGGRAATGDWLMFIDADSYLSVELMAAISGLMQSETVGGGSALLEFDEAPWWGRLGQSIHRVCAPLVGCGAGPCMFIRREGFEAVGGFRSDVYAAEELLFCRDAGRWATRQNLEFRILRTPHIVTSGRRFRINSKWEILEALFAVSINRRSRNRCHIWYDGRR